MFDFEIEQSTPLHEIKLSELTKASLGGPDFDAFLEESAGDEALTSPEYGNNTFATIRYFCEKYLTENSFKPWLPGYSLAVLRTVSGVTLLAARCDHTGEIAGGVIGKNIAVKPAHQGRGLGQELLILSFDKGFHTKANMNQSNPLSTAGLMNRIRAHKKAVVRALDRGVEVPSEVLDEYPDLRAAPQSASM